MSLEQNGVLRPSYRVDANEDGAWKGLWLEVCDA
jgi:hypothetical protein